jgi:RNA polymerase sigma-70 factor (ECF subfamily)
VTHFHVTDPQPSDEAQMAAYLAGDPRAFAELFRRYAPLLTQYFRRRAWQTADCHDLVQQTFLQLHRARAEFREGERLRPWLFTIARNVGCDYARKVSRRCELPCDVESQPAQPLAAVTPVPSLAVEASRSLALALARLSLPDRQLIDEHFGEDRSFGELASRHGVRATTLRVRAHRARAKLRELLTEHAA